ncbi:hypothetical protein [Pseudogemmobacter bohemicus]|nr:hypothetical protein [Pseudogemmobacter bohemicus]
MSKLQPLLPYALGIFIAAVLYIFPEAKPIACGAGAVLPFALGGN